MRLPNWCWKFMARFDKGGCDHVWRSGGCLLIQCPKCHMPYSNRLKQG